MTRDTSPAHGTPAAHPEPLAPPTPSAAPPQPAAPTQPAAPSRRSVLKAIGIGGGAVLLAGAAAGGVRGATNGAWAQGEGAPYELWESWRRAPGLRAVVAAGVLAANPHNTQPWWFVLEDHAIEVHRDGSRAMPTGDADGRELVAGLGCAVENMVVAAAARGWDVTVAPWPDGASGPAARLELVDAPRARSTAAPLAEAIATRRTNRGPYTGSAVAPELLAGLADGGPPGADIAWVTEAGGVAAVGGLLVEATDAVVADDAVSREAFGWFRGDRAGIERHRDGLTLACQGLDGLTLLAATLLPAQSRRGGDAFWARSVREVHTATARAYGVVRVPDVADDGDRLAGGRLLQRVHLAATAAGLALQPMNQVTERMAREAALGEPDTFGERWAEATGVPAREALLAFRVGYPVRPALPSPRRRLADVLRAP